MSAASILALAAQCAPNVAPQTVAAIVQTESRGAPFAINVNGARQPPAQRSALGAAATARRFVAAGYSVDLGLGQINSRNMRKLGLTWDTVFDPCTNIGALGRILTGNFEAALNRHQPQAALRVAFSLYNTGSSSRGFRNGYVGKVVGAAGVSDAVPGPPQRIADANDLRTSILADNTDPRRLVAPDAIPPPDWNVFESAAHARRTQPASSQTRRTSVWSD